MSPYRVFRLSDSIIYLGPLLALLVAVLLVPSPARWVVLAVAAFWGFICSRLFIPRWKIAKSIAFYASSFAVIPQGAPLDEGRVKEVVATTLAWWEKFLDRDLSAVGDGGQIVFTVTETGITDVRFPELKPSFGLTSDNFIRLQFNPKDPERVWRCLPHELAHAVANHLALDVDHHAYFLEIGYPFA